MENKKNDIRAQSKLSSREVIYLIGKRFIFKRRIPIYEYG